MQRFSRQLVIPEISLDGQQLLKKASVLIVGMGGLGAPAAMYLAGAGVGTLGLLDHDQVDLSNLHRQVIHSEATVGLQKCESARSFLKSLNSSVSLNLHDALLSEKNAEAIIQAYDVVIDATDNIATRYLLSDWCVWLGKPLVSASALRWEGHLSIYGWRGGPCFRCLFPIAPPTECVTNCNQGGIVGPVTGVLGSLQALECLKVILSAKSNDLEAASGKMVYFDGKSATFRTLKLRARRPDCNVCGDNPSVTKGPFDYASFCYGAPPNDHEGGATSDQSGQRISCQQLAQLKEGFTLIDVRDEKSFSAAHIKGALNIPIAGLKGFSSGPGVDRGSLVVCICARGVSSQRAASLLREEGFSNVVDVVGGMIEWQLRDLE